MKPPKVKPKPTLPFTVEEMEKIIWACDLFGTNGRYRAKNRTRIKAKLCACEFDGVTSVALVAECCAWLITAANGESNCCGFKVYTLGHTCNHVVRQSRDAVADWHLVISH